MTSGLGSISGNIIISGKQAIAEYAAIRAANATTVEALTASSATFAKVGTLALGAGAGIAALFGVAIDQAAQFEKKIDYFGAVTNATQADMDAIAAKAISMSKTTIFSADQMADAMVDFGKAGLSTQDILGGVADATADLAQAAGINIDDASNIIVSAMDTFHIKASDAVSISNELAGAANASIIDVSDLATSLKYAGGVAEAAGVPMNSVVTALALLGNAGIKGSQGGTILRQVMVSLTAPTAAATKELKALGIESANGASLFVDATGKLKPLDQIFQILKDHTADLTQAQTLAATKTIFNSRALAGANILLQDGAAGFATMSAQIANTTAEDVASKRLDNLAGDTTKFKNAVQTMLIEAGTPLQDSMRGIVQRLTQAVLWFGSLSASTQSTVFKVLAGVAAFLLLVGALSMFIAVILRVILIGKQLYAAFKLVKAGILLIRDGFIMLQLVMEANPLILIITIVALVVAALIYCWFHFKGFRDVVLDVFKAVKNAAIDVWHALETAFHAVVNAAESAWKGIKVAFDAIIDFIEAAVKLYWKYFVQPWIDAAEAVYEALMTAYNWVVKIIGDVLNWVEGHWRLLLAIFLGPLGLIIDAITNHLSWIKNLFTTVWTAIADFMTMIWNKIWGIITTVASAIQDALSATWNFIWNIIQIVFNAIVAYYMFQWNLLITIFTDALNFIENLFVTIWTAITGAVSTAWNAIVAFLTPAVVWVQNLIESAWNGLKNTTITVWGAITGAISTAWNAVINPISSAINTAMQSISSVINGVGNVWNSVWNWIKQVVQDVWNFISPIIDKINQAVGKVAGAIKTATGALNTAGGAVSNFFGFDDGGSVPGKKGAPVPAIVHGGEFVLSNDMLSGKQRIPGQIMSALAANQLANAQARNSLASLAGSLGSSSGSAAGQPSTAGARNILAGTGSSSTDKSITIQAVVNNPQPEPASDSLARQVRSAGYLIGASR